MKHIIRITLFAIALLGLGMLWFTPGAHAQSPYGLDAQVDAQNITSDDTVTLTLTLTTPDGSAPQLNLPPLDGFNVVGAQTGSQYSIVNGQASSSMVYGFQLQPTRTGDIRIPSLKLDMNGQILSTAAITVRVTQGNGAPTKKNNSPLNALGASPLGGSAFGSIFGNDPFADPFFSNSFSSNAKLELQAATDKPSVFVGEPLQYSVRVWSDATLLGEPDYAPPKFTGFWAHQPPMTQRGMNGSEITTLLFPTQAGKLTIDPATIRADGGFFSNPLEKQTQPIAIEVKPLPQGAPAEFNGAVGVFDLTATPDKTATRVGEPITVKVEIRGAGNFDTLPDPKWQTDANWRAYDGKARTSSEIVNGKLVGTKTFERTLIPIKEGTLTIPATRYAYFDPSDAQYHALETNAIEVQVAPGDPALTQNSAPSSTNANALAANPPTAAPNAPALKAALALKAAPAQLTTAAPPLTAQPLCWAMFFVPLGIVALDLAFGLRKRYLDNHSAERRASRAYRHAMRDLRRVRKNENAEIEVARLVLIYLEDKLNRTLLGVPHSTLAQLVTAHNVSADAALQVVELLRGGEANEFGKQHSITPSDMIAHARTVLMRVEEEWEG